MIEDFKCQINREQGIMDYVKDQKVKSVGNKRVYTVRNGGSRIICKLMHLLIYCIVLKVRISNTNA